MSVSKMLRVRQPHSKITSYKVKTCDKDMNQIYSREVVRSCSKLSLAITESAEVDRIHVKPVKQVPIWGNYLFLRKETSE